ncbi:hypothetical protein TcCL_NonESM04030 [Trypanosoma cruzi]|nr:hypothetical protein TcCL_NonESM04030 [Trypanosoma cruzi]
MSGFLRHGGRATPSASLTSPTLNKEEKFCFHTLDTITHAKKIELKINIHSDHDCTLTIEEIMRVRRLKHFPQTRFVNLLLLCLPMAISIKIQTRETQSRSFSLSSSVFYLLPISYPPSNWLTHYACVEGANAHYPSSVGQEISKGDGKE